MKIWHEIGTLIDDIAELLPLALTCLAAVAFVLVFLIYVIRS